jgi:hypothetical protein
MTENEVGRLSMENGEPLPLFSIFNPPSSLRKNWHAALVLPQARRVLEAQLHKLVLGA